jgi:acetoin:2,6-dichlorophenolindophenol oxidoreductase subunit alpha
MKGTPSLEARLEMYRRIVLVRRLEEGLGVLHKQGKTRGPIHRCDGQEAVGIGATAMLRDTDFLTSTHRGHAHFVGKGLDLHRIIAEIFGRKTGYCGGRAGHMLIADASKGMLGGNAIVGACIPAAAGMALSSQILGNGRVAMCIFGDGAAQTGIWHETMNMAALWKLPLIFVLEHNEFGLTVHSTIQSSVQDLSSRAPGYGIPATIVDGNDVAAVYKAVAPMVDRARRGEGPGMVECKTYRLEGFSTSDMGGYQPAADIAKWKERDPLRVAFDALTGEIGEARLAEIEQEATVEVRTAFDRALSDPLPEFDSSYTHSAYAGAS